MRNSRLRAAARQTVVAMVLLLATVRPAFGHALYERSEPAAGAQLTAPGQIHVWFTEEIEPGFSRIQVLDANRRRVDLEDTQAVPGAPRALTVSVGALPDGTYTVSWKALSAVDGHVTQGVFPVVVGAAGLSGTLEDEAAFVPKADDVVARWIGYLATLALAGGFVFRLWVLAPALTAASSIGGRQTDLVGTFDSRFRRFALVATAVLLFASMAGMTFQAAYAADVPVWQAFGDPLARLLATRLGWLWQARLALALLIAVLLCWASGRLLWWGGLAAGVVLLGAISLNSHAAALPTATWLWVALDWLHQVAAAAWVGGLFSLTLVLLPALRRMDSASRTAVLAALVPRFSQVAVAAVIVLTISGMFQAWLQVKSWPALATLYGGSLILKLFLVVPLLALGAVNLLLARPRLLKAAAARGRKLAASGPGLVRRFRWIVAGEATLGVGVLLATAVLTAAEPARETHARQSRPIELAGTAEDVGVELKIAPGRPGANTFEVRVDTVGQSSSEVQRVTLRFTYLDQDLGPGNLVLEPREDGSYGAVGSNLSSDGNWQIETLVRRRGRDDVRAGFRIEVVSAELAGRPPSLDAIAGSMSVAPRQAMAVGLMGLGLVLAAWIARVRNVRRTERLALYAASFAVAVIGGVLYSRAAAAPEVTDVRSLRSPFAPDTASLARGKQVYEELCVSCHGPTGRGDGPLAPTLRPRPADFREHMAAGHTDGELYTWVTEGMPGTAMPAFGGQLSDADRWHVINYIRGFAPQTE